VGNEQFHSSLVTIKGSVPQWRPVEHVLGIYVGTLGNEQLDHGGVACTGCQLKRRVARIIPFIDVGARGDKLLYLVYVTVLCSIMNDPATAADRTNIVINIKNPTP